MIGKLNAFDAYLSTYWVEENGLFKVKEEKPSLHKVKTFGHSRESDMFKPY